jgi:diguanylate cyclase (GGDEF)-like protein
MRPLTEKRFGTVPVPGPRGGVSSSPIRRGLRGSCALRTASYDEATGCLTRPLLRAGLSDAIIRAQREKRPAAFLLAGVDNLRAINRAYGFDVADEVVVRVAARIRDYLPDGTIGRFSDSKFGLVVEDIDDDGMIAIAEALMAAVRDSVIETEWGPVAATLSVGCVPLPHAARTSRLAMRLAREALEQAYNSGHDRVAVYRATPEQDRVRRGEISLARCLIGALHERRLVLAYQPIVDAATLCPVEYECLLRIEQADGGLMEATAFIPTAERLGLVRSIDRRALELAVGTLECHPDIRLSLNVSATSAADPNWLGALLALIDGRTDIAPRLTVEITETMAIHDLAEAARFVATLRDLGCHVGLDDFGAGYTSFRHLRSLAIDTVKIDGSFVVVLADNPDNQLFVRTLVDLARNFGVTTVAESVTDAATAELLRGYGVERLQGFYCGRPETSPRWAAGPNVR